MSDLSNSVSDDHFKLMESIRTRVDSIYKQLCEFEELIISQNIDDIGYQDSNIMDLLDTLDTIQEATQMIRPYNSSLQSCYNELESQILCLEKTMQLMELNTKME